nr:helix-turn-helix domain-containing protein [Clavibacter michiganensis]
MSRDLSDVRFLTVAEVAEMMRVSKMTVYRLVHSGDLPAIRFGRSFRVPSPPCSPRSTRRTRCPASPARRRVTPACRMSARLL